MGWTVAQGWVLAWCAVYCVCMLTICNANVYLYMVRDCGLLDVMCLCVYDFVLRILWYYIVCVYHVFSNFIFKLHKMIRHRFVVCTK